MVQLYKRKVSEVLVNTETSGHQSGASITVLANGGFVVVWSDGSGLGVDSSGFGIKAQLFDANGAKVGSEFLVNTTLTGNQTGPTVATLTSGRFVVSWTDASATGADTSSNAVRARIYEADGTPVGTDFVVNTTTDNSQATPAITELSGGGFLVTWSDSSGLGADTSGSGVKAQLFDVAGTKVGSEFLVNTTTAGSQGASGINAIGVAGGGFAVAYGTSGVSAGVVVCSVFVQLFDANGAKVGGEQVINTDPKGNLSSVNIAALDAGFIVTWAQQDSPQEVGVPVTYDLHAQLYDPNGAKLGGEFIVNSTTTGSQTAADVDRLPGGGFLVTWQGGPAGGATEIYGQFFDEDGTRVGNQFLVSSFGGSGARIDVLPSGDIVIVFTETSTAGDVSGTSVRMDILTLSTEPPANISLDNTEIGEVAIDNLSMATLSALHQYSVNSQFTYSIVSDSSGGAFRIDGDQLVVDDSSKLDFETAPTVALRIRVTDLNGQSFEKNFTITIDDIATEERYAAGGEFVVSTDAHVNSGTGAVAALASGGFAILTSWSDAGGSQGQRLQVFDEAWAPVGDAHELDLGRGGAQLAMTTLSSGGVVVVYEGDSISVPGGNAFPIKAQLFDAAGNAIGGEILVSSTNAGILTAPAVTLLANGNFAVAWTLAQDETDPQVAGSQVVAQLFDGDGGRIGSEFRLNTGSANAQGGVRLAALPGGGFLASWSEEQAGNVRVEAQIFDASGAKVGNEFLLVSRAASGGDGIDEYHLTALSDGNVLFSWSDLYSANPNVYITYARTVGPTGGLGDVMQLFTSLEPDFDVAPLANGGFALALAVPMDLGETSHLVALLFDAQGRRISGGELPESMSQGMTDPRVAVLASGDIVFAYSGPGATDGQSETDSYARVLTRESSTIAATEGPDTLNGTEGSDTIFGHGGDDTIYGLGGMDILRGEAGNDTLFGNDGNDFLVGGPGNDILVGGEGDDTYYIDSTADAISEYGGQGFDRIAATITLALAADADIERLDVEDLTSTNAIDLTGSAIGNVIYGNDGVNILRGEAGNDELRGFGGDDFLVGGPGTDLMVGGAGNDTFYVDDASDAIGEIAGEGNDRIAASVSFVLSNGADVELLEAVNVQATTAFDLTGSDSANTITGNAGVNILRGEGGNDILNGAGGDDFLVGGGGNDVMNGGTGNDTYYVDSAADVVNEFAGEGTNDRVAASVSYALSATSDVERLEADPQTGTNALNLTGSSIANLIAGNDGANVLDGRGGSDTLTGFGGADTFQFTTAPGADNIDTIVGFVTGSDRIALDDAVFTQIGPAGALNANAFFAGTAAHDADDRIIYNQTTGALLYDADGNGAGAAVQFATLSGNPALAASDFVVI